MTFGDCFNKLDLAVCRRCMMNSSLKLGRIGCCRVDALRLIYGHCKPPTMEPEPLVIKCIIHILHI